MDAVVCDAGGEVACEQFSRGWWTGCDENYRIVYVGEVQSAQRSKLRSVSAE